jgi:hypothetical protein
VARLTWTTVTFEQFVEELHSFRDRFYHGRSDEEHAYLRTRELLGDLPYTEAAELSHEIVWFLNQWKCRLPVAPTTAALTKWVRAQEGSLQDQRDSTILDPRVTRRGATYQRLYDSLLGFKRQGVSNMGDAAASKILHQLNPALFVMWDTNIKPYAESYSDFMARMHGLALRLTDSAPAEAQDDLEGYLQTELGYPVRKTLAKYLDEYNWFVAFGADRVAP